MSPNISELYTYDQINQVKSLDRGTLNVNNDAVTVSNFTEAWNFDKTGNWMQYDKNGTIENRTHNAANELQGTATHDANGNMTLMPGLKGKYDAWNRLVEVRDASDNLIARYDYNGRNQRIQKTVGSTVTKSFFNEEWQELEETTGSDLTAFVWGLRYIDDLVLREKGEERLYSLADPNWNIVAIIDVAGVIQERMKYDAFGKITWMDSAFATKINSDFSWNRTFTGQVLDAETTLMPCRYRFYEVDLGRFVTRDPIVYGAKDMSLYRYVNNSPTALYDMYGLKYGPTFKPSTPAASSASSPKPCGAVSLYNDAAGMPIWKEVAKQTGKPVTMKGKGANAVTDFTSSNSCCIPTLTIIDHGVPGNQWIEGKAITPTDAKTLCGSLCAHAVVRFFGCNVANGDLESIRLMFDNCPQVDTIIACPDNVTNTNIPDDKSKWNYGCNSTTVVGGKNLPGWIAYGPNDLPLVPTTKPKEVH